MSCTYQMQLILKLYVFYGLSKINIVHIKWHLTVESFKSEEQRIWHTNWVSTHIFVTMLLYIFIFCIWTSASSLYNILYLDKKTAGKNSNSITTHLQNSIHNIEFLSKTGAEIWPVLLKYVCFQNQTLLTEPSVHPPGCFVQTAAVFEVLANL